MGVAVSDDADDRVATEYIAPEPFADFLTRLKDILREKEIGLIVIGMPRNMDGKLGRRRSRCRSSRRR